MGCDLPKLIAKGRTGGKDNEGNQLIDKKILLLGLENAGKTSLLLQYKEK